MKNDIKEKVLERYINEFWYAPYEAMLRSFEVVIWENIKIMRPVLNIGCGDGRNEKLVFGGKKFDVGMDPDESVIEPARRSKLFKKVIKANANNIPFKDNSFSTVVSNSVFEHMVKDTPSVKEVARVLKKGGKFYFTVPTQRFPEAMQQAGIKKSEIKKFNNRVIHRRYRTFDKWKSILKKYNLKYLYHQYYFSPSFMHLWYKFFKFSSFKPYRRELWSYMKDSPYGKLFPKKLIANLSYLISKNKFVNAFGDNGIWVFIAAEKI